MPLSEGRVGEFKVTSGNITDQRFGVYRDLIVNDVGLGRYFEAARLGRLMVATTTAAGFSIANATFVAPLAAASTPIIGIFNPQGNAAAAVILKATVGILPVGPATTTAEPVWVAATPNAGITAATTNVTFASARFDAAAATTMRGYANAALTGLINPIALGPFGGQVAGTSGALSTTAVITDEVAGALIVTPGAFLGVLVTTTPVAATANANIWYAEIDWPLP